MIFVTPGDNAEEELLGMTLDGLLKLSVTKGADKRTTVLDIVIGLLIDKSEISSTGNGKDDNIKSSTSPSTTAVQVLLLCLCVVVWLFACTDTLLCAFPRNKNKNT